MPQFVLRHGSFYAREGETEWRLGPTPTGHERTVHEIAAMDDLANPAEAFYEQREIDEDCPGWPPFYEAVPCEVRLPKVKPKVKARKEVSA